MAVKGQQTSFASSLTSGAFCRNAEEGSVDTNVIQAMALTERAIMQVIINSDNQIDVQEDFIRHWQSEITSSLKRYSDWITRVEVHLTDENSAARGGVDDIRCLIEARPADRQPVSIEVRGESAENTLADGIQTLNRRLATLVDKARTQKRKG